ncbi:SMP-30/gluconolactonase/LRE family protein [Solicola sp. PLA-1-18]|uniref:SMP-30/gluconolactonase/LRE family protein n=1 Tax=Solicola sp. PLA-1-18 TaxID=3380532 RepID=UPI003B7C806A
MRLVRPVLLLLTAAALVLVGASPSVAASPDTYRLPDGFQPEGIATGPGRTAYLGSRVDGRIVKVDLRSGRVSPLAAGPGTPSLGLKVDGKRLFVAGGTGGDARVLDTRTGRTLASYDLATAAESFVNDVIVTRDAAYFTDSRNPVLYKLPLGRKGALPKQSAVERIDLTGDLVYGEGNNANGIERTPDGRALLVVQSNTGLLFRVDPRTGVTRTVDLGGTSLVNGDGLLLEGRTLYAVQNRLNAIAVLRLDKRGTAGVKTGEITDRRFDVPSTVARDGQRLLLPNARFTTPPTATTRYDVVAVRAGRC